MSIPAIFVAAVIVVGSVFFASKAMLVHSHLHQVRYSASDIKEFIKDVDARRGNINKINKQAVQEVEQLCKHIREGDLTSDSAFLGYRASGKVKKSYRLAEELYNLIEEEKKKVESSSGAAETDLTRKLYKYFYDCMYELSTEEEKLLITCNMLLDDSCSGSRKGNS